MEEKSFNRTVEAINDLLDKLDNLPDYPLVFKGGLNNPSYLPSEATQGDLYLVMYANNDNTGLANSLYYRTHTNQWDIIANISYTKAQIDDKLDNIADNAELSTYTAGAGTSFETVANTDTVTDAIEKVQNNALFNKTNISLLEQANGAKNLYRFEDLGATAGSGSGVTLTDNGDGTFSATGTASGANYARYLLKQAPIKAGNYIISGISGGALTSYRLRVGTGSGDAYIVNLEDNYAQFTIANDTTITVQFVVNSGVTVTNLSIKPMIITKAMYEAGFTDYQPYALSNAELTAALSPSAFTAPTMETGITLESGGYTIVGNIVILNLRINLANSLTGAATLFSDLPIPLAESSLPVGSSVVSTSNSKGVGISITTAGYAILNTGGTLPSGVVMISAIYVKA